jgi:hypothetical protein
MVTEHHFSRRLFDGRIEMIDVIIPSSASRPWRTGWRSCAERQARAHPVLRKLALHESIVSFVVIVSVESAELMRSAIGGATTGILKGNAFLC